MGNWIPNDPTLVAQILKISSAYTPPPPAGFVSPMTWGIEDDVIERFTAAGVPAENISFERDTYTFNFPGTPSELVRTFTENLLAYALGRRVEYFDQPTIRAIAKAAEANDYKMSSFILGVIKSDAFQLKRSEPIVSQ